MGHQTGKLLQVDLAVTVQVCLSYHGPHLGLGQRLAEVAHGEPQFLLAYQAVTVSVEDFKSMCNIIITTVSSLYHHVNKLIEVDGSIKI